jgi:hypothetical protein
MKTVCFVFMMIGCAVLMHKTSYAAPSDTAAEQSSFTSSADTASDRPRGAHAALADGGKRHVGEKPSGEQPGNRRPSGKNHPPSQARLPKTNRPNQPPKGRERSTSGDAMNPHESGSDKSGGAAKAGLIQNETVNSAPRVRPPSAVRLTAPSIDNARHRSPNSAVVGGSANSTTRNTGAINGTRMNRKP